MLLTNIVNKKEEMFKKDWEAELPEGFPEASRVWIYQGSQPFSEEEEIRIRKYLQDYVDRWVSHNRPVKSWATVLFGQFILIMADDTMDKLCGSAIDDSFRFIKKLEAVLGIVLLDRMQLGFLVDGNIKIIPLVEAEKALQEKELNGDSLFFNNGIATRAELLRNWIIPVKKSFLAQRGVLTASR